MLTHPYPESIKLHPDIEMSTDRVQARHLRRAPRAQKNGATEVERGAELDHVTTVLKGLGGPLDVEEVCRRDGEPVKRDRLTKIDTFTVEKVPCTE